MQKFEDKEYLQSFLEFFDFLMDEKEQNVRIFAESDRLLPSIYNLLS